MENIEPKSNSGWWDSHINYENSKWLAESLERVDQRVKEMLNMIEEDGCSSGTQIEICYQKKPELIAHVEEFYNMYQLLAERYENLAGELGKNISSPLQMKDTGICDSALHKASLLLTPDQKLGSKKSEQAVGFSLIVSSGGGSSDSSPKEGYESSSSLSPDSDSESFDSSIYKSCVRFAKDDGKVAEQKLSPDVSSMIEKVSVTQQKIEDATLKLGENRFEMLFRRIAEYEEELRVANKKIQLSEEKIAMLEGELNKNQSVIFHMDDLQARLESAQCDIKMKEADLEVEKRKVSEVQEKVVELESQVVDSNDLIRTLQKELEITIEKFKGTEDEIASLNCDLSNEHFECAQLQSQLDSADKDIALLEAKLDTEKNHVSQMQEWILRYMADVSVRDKEIAELKLTFCDAQQKFSLEKAQLQSDIASLLEQKVLLEARIEESKLQSGSLENEIKRCEAEKMEMKGLHEDQEISWQCDIERLKAELIEEREGIEVVNKNLDILKLKYDMLMTERDGISAKVNLLGAELCSRDNKIQHMEDHLSQLQLEHVALIAASESTQSLIDELKLRVEDLKKEVDMQRVVISDRAEEKREAIRQLCFSLDHYRSGYKELCQAFGGHKRPALTAL